MAVNLFKRTEERETYIRKNEYIKKLQRILVEDGKNTINDLESVVLVTNKLVERLGGEEKIHELDSFLASKLFSTLDLVDKNKHGLKRYCNKETIKLKDMVEILERTISTRSITSSLREYNSRLREEKLVNQL